MGQVNVAQGNQALSPCLAERRREGPCRGGGHRLRPERRACTRQGLAAFTCRCPRASLGSSTCVPAPGAAAADPGSCPAAPSPLLPGSEVGAPSGTLRASPRRRSPLPALHPAPPRPLSVSPAGGAGEQGRLPHLRGAQGSGGPGRVGVQSANPAHRQVDAAPAVPGPRGGAGSGSRLPGRSRGGDRCAGLGFGQPPASCLFQGEEHTVRKAGGCLHFTPG